MANKVKINILQSIFFDKIADKLEQTELMTLEDIEILTNSLIGVLIENKFIEVGE